MIRSLCLFEDTRIKLLSRFMTLLSNGPSSPGATRSSYGISMAVAWRLIEILRHCVSGNEYSGLYFFTPYSLYKGKDKAIESASPSTRQSATRAPFSDLFALISRYSWSRLFVMQVLSTVEDLLAWFKSESPEPGT